MNRILVFVFTLLLASQLAYAQVPAEDEYILFVSAIGLKEIQPEKTYNALVEEYEDRGIRVISQELIVSAIDNKDELENTIREIRSTYTHAPRLVIFWGSPGWNACHPLFENEWKDIPAIVIAYKFDNKTNIIAETDDIEYIDDDVIIGTMPSPILKKGKNVTFIEVPLYMKETIEVMKRLIPDMDTLLFLSDERQSSASARNILSNIVKSDFPSLNLKLITLPETPTEELISILSKEEKRTGVIYYSWFLNTKKDGSNKLENQIIHHLSDISNYPLFTFRSQQTEFAGGYYTVIEDCFKPLISVADKILSGTRADELPEIVIDNAKIYLDQKYLVRHGIAEKDLIDDAIYSNKLPTFFQKYREQLIYSLLILCFLAIFIVQYIIQKIKTRRAQLREMKLLQAYKQLVEKMPVIFIKREKLYDEKGNIADLLYLNINKAYEKEFSVKRENIIGKKYSEIIKEYPEMNTNNLLGSADVQGVLSIIKPDGSLHYFQKIIIKEHEQATDIVFLIDKTESQNSLIKAKGQQEFISLLINNIPIPISVRSINDGMRYNYFNKEAERFFGIKEKDLIHTVTPSFFDQKTASQILEINDRVIQTNGSFAEPMERTLANGEKKFLFTTKNILTDQHGDRYLLTTSQDITELQQNRQKLLDFSNKFRMILLSTHMCIWEWDIKEESCHYESLEKTKEKDAVIKEDSHNITKKDFFKLIHKEDQEKINLNLERISQGEIEVYRDEFRFFSDENKVYEWQEVFAIVSQFDQKGKPLTLVGALFDIEERKETERALLEAKIEADKSNQLKSAFLANMSHEIRTPLNAIVGFSNLLVSTDDQEEKSNFFDIIDHNNEMLLQIISDILDLSKIESGTLDFKMEKVSIKPLFVQIECTSRMKQNKASVVKIIFEQSPELAITTDQFRLMQVVTNFINNAIKFTKFGSIKFGYRLQNNDKEIYFYVTDTGIGISHEKKDLVFSRFVKLNDLKQGTGLGLAISRSIIEQMKGTIGVDSEEGKGSTFWFILPNK